MGDVLFLENYGARGHYILAEAHDDHQQRSFSTAVRLQDGVDFTIGNGQVYILKNRFSLDRHTQIFYPQHDKRIIP